MTQGERPLLADRRPSSDQSHEGGLAEEDALLTGEHTERKEYAARGWKFWREIGLFAWATIATAIIIVLAVVYQTHESGTKTKVPQGKRNLIFMVSDGMGPTSLSMTRSFKQFKDGEPWSKQLVIDQHLIGQSRTRSSSSLVTDSAAGATAFSCGMKSYNGAISVLPGHDPCGTVLEAAKKAGYMTGLVVTTRITDATPACFAAHVNMRGEEDRIAEQMTGHYPLGRMVDLMLGGGRCHFLPNGTEGSCRGDNKNVIEMATKNQGFTYIDSRKDFDGLKGGDSVKFPLLGLFAPTDIPYEIDRRNENHIYPALDEMATTALKALSKATEGSDKGFFIMIEGSRIDHAGHGNDPAAQVHEVLAYDKTFAAVLKFLEEDKTPGVLVSTSDHETGGLAAARQLHESYPDYLWYPGVLNNASASAERVTDEYHDHLDHNTNKDNLRSYLSSLVSDRLGIHDANDDEISLLADKPDIAAYTFAEMISRRAQIGWSTHGHSAADVNIYASKPDAAPALIGNHENTEVGDFLADYLDVDRKAVTRELQEKGTAWGTWMGAMPEANQRLDGQDHLQHYTGDAGRRHKRCSICNA